MNAFTSIAITNTALVLAVAAISLTGLFMFGSFNGLWSILMLLFMQTAKSGKSDD